MYSGGTRARACSMGRRRKQPRRKSKPHRKKRHVSFALPDETSVYTHMHALSLRDLLRLPPPPLRFPTSGGGDADNDGGLMSVETHSDDRSAYSTYTAAHHAQLLNERLAHWWAAQAGAEADDDAAPPTRDDFEYALKRLDAYALNMLPLLNVYVKDANIKRWSTLNVLFVVRSMMLAIMYDTVNGAADGGEHSYRELAGRVSGVDTRTLLDYNMIIYTVPIVDYTALQVYQALVHLAERWSHFTCRSDAEYQDVSLFVRRLEMHAGRILLRPQREGEGAVRDLDDAAPERAAMWFVAGARDRDGTRLLSASYELVSEYTTMFAMLRRSLRMRRKLVPLGGADGAIPTPASDPTAGCFSVARVHALVDYEMNEMHDRQTFLQAIHRQCTALKPSMGESERYQRDNRGMKTRDPADLLTAVRWSGEIEYWMQKNIMPSYELMWYEELNDFYREMFLHTLITVQIRARARSYNWKEANVIYEQDAFRYANADALAYICNERRTQPLIFQTMGAFFVQHRGTVYRTFALGQATAMWFRLAVVDELPADAHRIVAAYRRYLWDADNGEALRDVDSARVHTEPPPGFCAVGVGE